MSVTNTLKEYDEALAAVRDARKRYLSTALVAEAADYIAQIGGCRDHEAYAEKVVPYWEKFGYVPEEIWFELAGSRDQVIDPRFMPLDLLYTELIPYLNNMQFASCMVDKSYYETWFPDAPQAKTVCNRIAGIFYDDKMDIISRDEALKLCMERACVLFIKPSVYTWSGKGISAADTRVTDMRELDELFEKTGMNFIVQEEIKQHPQLAVLNPDSTATIRINSLLMDGKVHILSEVMRVSSPGEKVPLQGDRDYFTQILKDGSLHEKALFIKTIRAAGKDARYEFGWGNAKERGLYDESYRVPSMDRVEELAVKLHERLARYRFIAWDFTVDTAGEPLLIELNLSPGLVAGQLAIGSPMFGDMTDRVLGDFFFGRSLEDAQKQGLLVQ